MTAHASDDPLNSIIFPVADLRRRGETLSTLRQVTLRQIHQYMAQGYSLHAV